MPEPMTFDQLQAAWREDQKTVLAEALKGYAPLKVEEPPPGGGKVTMHNMGVASAIESLDGFRIPVVNVAFPFASAVIGTSIGLVEGGVLDKALPERDSEGKVNILNPLAHVAVAVGDLVVGSRFVGKPTAIFAAGTIGFKLAYRYTALPQWLQNLEDALSKPFVKEPAPERNQPRGVQAQADQIVRNAGPYVGTGL